MANLVCWVSGLLEILADKDTPLDSGPVVLAHGSAEYMRGLMVAHGEARKQKDDSIHWYVPGTKPIPRDTGEGEDALAQRENMTLVIEFNRRLNRTRRGGKTK